MDVQLLSAKLILPRQHTNAVERPRLLRLLDESQSYPMTLISAPAGSGKTTALSTWTRLHPGQIAWLTLDEGDNDPTRFWNYVLAALQTRHPELGEESRPLLRLHEPEAFLTALLNEIAALPETGAGNSAVTLVLDDYHVMNEPSVHSSIAFLVDNLPPQIHFAIASRADPPLPIARWRVQGRVAEIRTSDLRFTPDEAALFFNQSMGLNLSPADIAALDDHTEGWAAGLQLAALSLKRQGDLKALVTVSAHGRHYVSEYLTEEVLSHQPPEILSFLLRTSILDRLCGPICDVLTERMDSQTILQQLEKANLFTVRLDETGQWYRYHYLFAEALRLRLQKAHPEQVTELHIKASSWWEAYGDIDQAIRHAAEARDADRSARLVEQHFDEVLQRGEGATFRRWLSTIPKDVMGKRPRLSLAQAMAAFNADHLEQAEALLHQAERALHSNPPELLQISADKPAGVLSNVPASIALLRASLAGFRGDTAEMRRLAGSARLHLSEGDQEAGYSVRWNLGLADWMDGRLGDAERTFADIAAEGEAGNHLHLTLSARSILGQIQSAQGRLHAALHTYEDGLDFAVRAGVAQAPSVAYAHLGLAQVCYEWNQLELAQQHAMESITLGKQLTATQPLAMSFACTAWIRQALGDQAGAHQAIEQAYQLAPSHSIVALLNPVPAERARLLLIQGKVDEAISWVDGQRFDEPTEPKYLQERWYLMLVRVLLVRHAHDRALHLLDRILALAELQGRNETLIKAYILQALALDMRGDEAQVERAIETALVLAESEGYFRIFIDEGARILELLSGVPGEHKSYAAKLLDASDRHENPATEQGTVGREILHLLPRELIEPLTTREVEVLTLLAQGSSNREIADRLFLSAGTVKVHLKHIFAKLGVNSRTQAIARAREQNLL